MHHPEAALTPADHRLLKQTFLFSGVSNPVVDWALRQEGCACALFQKGEVIFSPEVYRRALGIVLSGAVQVSKGSGLGDDLVVSILEAGNLFGAASLFNEFPDYVTTIRAVRRCRALFFSQPLMEALLHRDERLAGNYIRYLSDRIHFLNNKLDGFLAGSAEQRLALFLLEQTEDASPLPCGMAELARRLHIGRASLYRAFESLQADGAIRREGKRLRILDRARLRGILQAKSQTGEDR